MIYKNYNTVRDKYCNHFYKRLVFKYGRIEWEETDYCVWCRKPKPKDGKG